MQVGTGKVVTNNAVPTTRILSFSLLMGADNITHAPQGAEGAVPRDITRLSPAQIDTAAERARANLQNATIFDQVNPVG